MTIHSGQGLIHFFYQSSSSDVGQVVDLPNTTSAVVTEIGDGDSGYMSGNEATELNH